jgi:hypothetical protein
MGAAGGGGGAGRGVAHSAGVETGADAPAALVGTETGVANVAPLDDKPGIAVGKVAGKTSSGAATAIQARMALPIKSNTSADRPARSATSARNLLDSASPSCIPASMVAPSLSVLLLGATDVLSSTPTLARDCSPGR